MICISIHISFAVVWYQKTFRTIPTEYLHFIFGWYQKVFLHHERQNVNIYIFKRVHQCKDNGVHEIELLPRGVFIPACAWSCDLCPLACAHAHQQCLLQLLVPSCLLPHLIVSSLPISSSPHCTLCVNVLINLPIVIICLDQFLINLLIAFATDVVFVR